MQTPDARPPPRWHKDVILKDGTPLRLRPIVPQDGAALERLFSRLSTRTIYRRFMALLSQLSEAAIRGFTHVDYESEMALVGVLPDAPEADSGSGEEIIAVGRYVRLPNPSHAEVAFTVEDAHQPGGGCPGRDERAPWTLQGGHPGDQGLLPG